MLFDFYLQERMTWARTGAFTQCLEPTYVKIIFKGSSEVLCGIFTDINHFLCFSESSLDMKE